MPSAPGLPRPIKNLWVSASTGRVGPVLGQSRIRSTLIVFHLISSTAQCKKKIRGIIPKRNSNYRESWVVVTYSRTWQLLHDMGDYISSREYNTCFENPSNTFIQQISAVTECARRTSIVRRRLLTRPSKNTL